MTLYFGWSVLMVLLSVGPLAVLAGFTLRINIVEARLIRVRPGWGYTALFTPVTVISVWCGYIRTTSWQAHIASYTATIVMLVLLALIFRPVLPILLSAGGIASNYLVMGVNGLRMPTPGPCDAGVHTCIDASTRLWWLADVIPLDVQGSVIMSAISVGDVLLIIGFALTAARIWLPQKQLT